MTLSLGLGWAGALCCPGNRSGIFQTYNVSPYLDFLHGGV